MTLEAGAVVGLKIFGERNSGTRYLERLLRVNVDVPLLRGSIPEVLPIEAIEDWYFRLTAHRNLGWKHSLAPGEELRRAPRVGFVTIAKNPYAWLLSLHRRPHHNPAARRLTFQEFLAAPWPTVARERHGAFENPIVMWNEKNRSYLALGGFAVTYEDLLRDPAGVVDRLAGSFSLPRRPGFFTNVEGSTKGDADRGFEYCRRYYLGEEWRAKLAGQDVAAINRWLDPSVVRALGYSMLDEAEAFRGPERALP